MHAALAIRLALTLIFGLAQIGRAVADDGYEATISNALDEYAHGRWEEAQALFAHAHQLRPSARTLRGMGLAAFETRQYVAAIGHLRAALADPRRPLTPEQKSAAEILIERASAFVVRLEIDVSPSDAQLFADGRPLERAKDGSALLDGGAHQLVVSAPGYEEQMRSVQWTAGTTAQLSIRLVKKLSSEPAEASRGAAPTAASGPHEQTRFRTGKWIAVGFTGATLALTGVAVSLRELHARRYNDRCLGPPDTRASSCGSRREAADIWKLTAIGAGAATVGLSALSATLFVLGARESSVERALSVCRPDPLALGVQCAARF